MTLGLTEADVSQVIDVGDAIDVLEGAFFDQTTGRATLQPRQRLATEGVSLQMMPGAVSGYFGYKTFTTGKGGAAARVFLYESANATLVAVIEAEVLGQIRTGAATGVGTRWLAPEEIHEAVLFGAGYQAESQLLAMDKVRSPGKVWIVNRSPEKARRFIDRMQPLVGASLEPAASPEVAVRRSRLITTITGSPEPVFDGEWVGPDTHINAAGGSALNRREIDAATVLRAGRIVVDSIAQARVECGELVGVLGQGKRHWDEVTEIKDVIRTGRRERAAGEISLFKSQGVGLADVAVAGVVYERALEKGLGRRLELSSGG